MDWRIWRMGVMVFGAMSLSACSSVQGRWDKFWGSERLPPAEEAAPSPAPGDESTGDQAGPAPVNDAPAPKPTPPAQPTQPAKPVQEAKIEPQPAPGPAPAGRLSKRLVGLDFDGIRALLGEPASVNEVSPGQEWSYHAQDCTLVVRFFPDVETLQYRALSISVRPKPDDPENTSRCHDLFAHQIGLK